MTLLSIQIGTPQRYVVPHADDPATDTYTSAIGKRPVAGAIRLGPLGLEGDAVADRRAHGGPDQAMLAYAFSHYAEWRAEGMSADIGPGRFGENLTVVGTDEEEACVGDRWQIGDVVVQVTKPRTPCNKLAWQHDRPELISRVFATGWSGWYLRVLDAGTLEAGQAITLLDRPHPEWTVRRVGSVMAHRQDRVDEARALSRCPALAADWRYRLAKGL